jgi:hypothetical protein
LIDHATRETKKIVKKHDLWFPEKQTEIAKRIQSKPPAAIKPFVEGWGNNLGVRGFSETKNDTNKYLNSLGWLTRQLASAADGDGKNMIYPWL